MSNKSLDGECVPSAGAYHSENQRAYSCWRRFQSIRVWSAEVGVVPHLQGKSSVFLAGFY